jgi:hypothetical protein
LWILHPGWRCDVSYTTCLLAWNTRHSIL